MLQDKYPIPEEFHSTLQGNTEKLINWCPGKGYVGRQNRRAKNQGVPPNVVWMGWTATLLNLLQD